MRAAIGRLHDSRTAARSDHKAVLSRRDGFGPLCQQLSQSPRIFVVAGHLHCGDCALALQLRGISCRDVLGLGGLLFAGSRLRGASVIQKLQRMIGLIAPTKARGAEEDHRVLDLLAAEPCQRLEKLRHNPDETPVGAVQESGVLIGQRRTLQRWRRSVSGNHGPGRRFRSCALGNSTRILQILHYTDFLIPVFHISTVPAANGVLKRNP